MTFKSTILCVCLAALPFISNAADYKASLAQMPVYAETPKKGVLVDFVKALAAASKKDIDFQVVPFAQSMKDVESGKVDFHMPLIEPLDISKANFSLSSATIFHVNFVLYTNKNKPIDMDKLGQANIETDAAHIPYFPFAINSSSSIEGSLKKLNLGHIDGFIFADDASDPIIASNKLTNINRQLYKRFDVKIILPKGGTGGATDQFLTDTINTLQESGEFAKIMGLIDHEYK